jgi:hypothetical protein
MFAEGGDVNERSMSTNHYEDIAKLHGMAGIGTANLDAYQWVAMYQKVTKIMGSGVVAGFGTDTDGLAPGMPPRNGETTLLSAYGAPYRRLTGSQPSFTLPQELNNSQVTYNQIQFMVVTGGDDLRGDSSATATLQAPNGATLQVISLKAQNQSSWDNNSTHTVTAGLNPPRSPSAIGRIVITLQSHDNATETLDNWDMQSVVVSLSNHGAGGSSVHYDDSFPRSSLGTRRWDYNTDGVAHYGMLPDFLKDARTAPGGVDVVDNSLMYGADYFLQTWKKCEVEKVNVH